MHKKHIAISILVSFAIALALTVVLVFAFQLPWWFKNNGFSGTGNCVNHFGEPYSCTLFDWLLRGLLSPLALISLVMPFFIACWLASVVYLRTKPLRLATASTITGCFILVPVLGPLLSIVALVLGIIVLRKAAHDERRVLDKGFALAGVILGALGMWPAVSFLLLALISVVGRRG